MFVKNQIVLFLVLFTSVILGVKAAIYDSFERLKITDNSDLLNAISEPQDACASFECQNDGFCLLMGEKPKCVCKERYIGLHCEERTQDPCALLDCQNNGACQLMGEKHICVCQEGFYGHQCEKKTEDSCASFECQNGGLCVMMGEIPRCVCKEEYFGARCEEKIDETSTTTQQIKITTENSKDEAIDPCFSMPCQNGGICLQNGNSFHCYCKPPYSGVFCEKDPCAENPCENGGSCVKTQYSFKCHCRYPYSGDTCQYVDACNDNPCLNGGTCVKDGDYFQCICKYGYNGKVCEKEGFESTTDLTTEFQSTSVSEVANYTEPTQESTKSTLNFNLTTTNPGICVGDADCLNGGICRNRYCECPPNFGGYRCEINFHCEKLKPTCTAMGAICRIVGLNAICDCPQDKMYHPKSGICEDICDPWKCMHGRCEIDGRTYKCNCDSGYTGRQCDEIVEVKVEKSYVLFAVMISLLVIICLLLIGQIWLFCQNRKFNLLINDRNQFLAEYVSSRPTASEA